MDLPNCDELENLISNLIDKYENMEAEYSLLQEENEKINNLYEELNSKHKQIEYKIEIMLEKLTAIDVKENEAV